MLKPTVVYPLFGDKVEVLIFGKSPHELDESHIAQIAREWNFSTVYHPDTHIFNGEVCRTIDFVEKTKIRGVKIYSGVLVDGVSRIGRGEAVWLRTADCPTIIAYNGLIDEMIVAHAGRASLIDEEFVRNNKPSRQPESIVQAMCERLNNLGRRVSADIEVYFCCGIGPMHFRHPTDHPEYGLFNTEMNRHIALYYGTDCFLDGDTERGALNLHCLIANQFKSCGVPGDNIHHDSIDTASHQDCFFSRRGGDPVGHNSILVIRRA